MTDTKNLPFPDALVNMSVRDLIENFDDIRLALVRNSFGYEDWEGGRTICYRYGFPDCSAQDNENYRKAHRIVCIVIERCGGELARLACKGMDFNTGRRDDIISILRILNDADFRTFGRDPRTETDD